MTTQTHTSGPWAVDYEGPAHLSIEDKAGRVLAFCNLQNEDGDEDEANARLIAAAPDLLEALRGAVGYAEMNGGFCDPPFWYIRAKNAIDATEGRAQ